MSDSLDILAALTTDTTERGDGRCLVGKHLDSIPAGTKGLDDLVSSVETSDPRTPQYRPLVEMQAVFRRLGMRVSAAQVGIHRRHNCRCFG